MREFTLIFSQKFRYADEIYMNNIYFLKTIHTKTKNTPRYIDENPPRNSSLNDSSSCMYFVIILLGEYK